MAGAQKQLEEGPCGQLYWGAHRHPPRGKSKLGHFYHLPYLCVCEDYLQRHGGLSLGCLLPLGKKIEIVFDHVVLLAYSHGLLTRNMVPKIFSIFC